MADALLRASLKQHSSSNLLICLIHSIPGYIFWAHLAPGFCSQFLNIVINQAKLGGVEGEEMKKKCDKMNAVMKYLIPMSVIAYAQIYLAHFDTDPSHQKVYSIMYYATHFVLSYWLVNVVALPAASSFKKILEKMPDSSKDEKTKKLENKMAIFLREVGNAGHFNTLCTAAFLFFPFLWDYQTFQLAFAWASSVPILLAASFIVMPVKRGSSKVSPNNATVTGTTTVVSSKTTTVE
ncbi:hypothetical protein TrRE_jg6618 [Triparma retinervis]|uniref:Uncharacterized protein n=1 Tax=Triparma retinervis TaxID=2557542 RepID=A0A9W7L2T9_9STRA|nr:hypothetical protein TrRE_jg6618 [Triparma retinervis]